jgi:hypothetical protein
MKKIFLLLAGCCSMFGANAQYARNSSTLFSATTKGTPFLAEQMNAKTNAHHLANKTTVAGIATETFGGGSATTLPPGWTTGGPIGKWHWTTVASTSTYSAAMGTMHSTTQSNGWMIFDSDSTGAGCSCAPNNWLQSPAYNCSGHTTVRLNFENYFEKFNDSCFVYVSTDPAFATYTVYPVSLNNGLGGNVSTANTSKVHINITAAAAGHAAVYIRFVYADEAGQTGGYAWMVDDLSLTELNTHDVSNSHSFLFQGEPAGTSFSGSIFNTPLEFVDSVAPVTLLANLGANVETNVVSTARIYQGTTLVYTDSITYPSLPINAFDSIIQFRNFKPAAIGAYKCIISTALSNDSDMTNNIDTATFNITDTTWMEAQGNSTGSYYIHRATGGAPLSYMNGARYDVPATAAGDTVSGFGVAFSSSSVPTGAGKVSVQLYSILEGVTTGWTYVASSVARPIIAADISSSVAAVWADFRIDQVHSGGSAPFILQPGTTYAAMVQIDNVTTDLLVLSGAAPNATGYSGYFGQSDTSQNDGATSFGSHSIATGSSNHVPFVRMYFGSVLPFVDHTIVKNIPLINVIGAAYPNPANTSVTIPFTTVQNGDVKITLTNMVGQVVGMQTINATAGTAAQATFQTGGLANGVYLYNVEANGGHGNGRITIAH